LLNQLLLSIAGLAPQDGFRYQCLLFKGLQNLLTGIVQKEQASQESVVGRCPISNPLLDNVFR